MRLIMAVSNDGFVAKGPTDDMTWLGPHDKTAFRLLTVAGSGVCGVSAKTRALMPLYLCGRLLVQIEREGFTLSDFDHQYREDCSLIGGQTLAIEAITAGLVDTIHLCRSDRKLRQGQKDLITPGINESYLLKSEMRIGDTVVETWRV